MGTRAEIILYAPNESIAISACRAAFKRIADLEQVMSDYRPRSELNQLCAHAGGPPVPVSDDLFDVLSHAIELSEKTAGAVDVTVGPLVKLWREARKAKQLPAPERLAAARALVGWHRVRLDPEGRTVQLAVPGMQLDLGGVAKGHAANQALNVLRGCGLPSALVNLGGDLALGEPPPGALGWRVKVFDSGDGQELLHLSNTTLCASGDTFQFLELGGKHYSHIVDPRTGLGVTHRTQAAVLAPEGWLSDGLATALCVLGTDALPKLQAAFPNVRFFAQTLGPPKSSPPQGIARKG